MTILMNFRGKSIKFIYYHNNMFSNSPDTHIICTYKDPCRGHTRFIHDGKKLNNEVFETY